MAVLGKIRSRGLILIIIIGLALFAFIAEEAFRSCNGIKGEARFWAKKSMCRIFRNW